MTSSVDISFSLRVTAKIDSSEDIVEQLFLNQGRDVLHMQLWRKIIRFQASEQTPTPNIAGQSCFRQKKRRRRVSLRHLFF